MSGAQAKSAHFSPLARRNTSNTAFVKHFSVTYAGTVVAILRGIGAQRQAFGGGVVVEASGLGA